MYAIVDWLITHNALLAALQLPALAALIWGCRKGWYGSGRDWVRTVSHMQAENDRMRQLVLSNYQIERIDTKIVALERDLAARDFWTGKDGTVPQQQAAPPAPATPQTTRAISLTGSIARDK